MVKCLCGVSYQYEIGECDDIHYYDTLEELKEKSKCWNECGVVRIEFDNPDMPDNYDKIKSKEWVVKQNMDWKSSLNQVVDT